MKRKSPAARKSQSANKLPSFSRDGEAHCFVGGAAPTFVPVLQLTEEFLYSLIIAMRLMFQPAFNRLTTRPLTRPTRTPYPLWTGNRMVLEMILLPETFRCFCRNGGDPMDCDISNVDLSLYLHSDTSLEVTLNKRTSRL
jgi:hypothetical protein